MTFATLNPDAAFGATAAAISADSLPTLVLPWYSASPYLSLSSSPAQTCWAIILNSVGRTVYTLFGGRHARSHNMVMHRWRREVESTLPSLMKLPISYPVCYPEERPSTTELAVPCGRSLSTSVRTSQRQAVPTSDLSSDLTIHFSIVTVIFWCQLSTDVIYKNPLNSGVLLAQSYICHPHSTDLHLLHIDLFLKPVHTCY